MKFKMSTSYDCNCILNNIMIGAFIYILRVHHVFHAHTTHELLGYVGGGVTPRVFNRVCIMLFLIYFPAGVLNCPIIVVSLDFFS
jgi:hypothetical protein